LGKYRDSSKFRLIFLLRRAGFLFLAAKGFEKAKQAATGAEAQAKNCFYVFGFIALFGLRRAKADFKTKGAKVWIFSLIRQISARYAKLLLWG
jgi:hypothetical protein